MKIEKIEKLAKEAEKKISGILKLLEEKTGVTVQSLKIIGEPECGFRILIILSEKIYTKWNN